jgi:hypothetical protein
MRNARLLLLISALMIGGCNPTFLAGVATPIVWQKKHVNFTNANFAAADTLVYNSANRLKKNRPLVVHDLHEIMPVKDPTSIYPQTELYKNPRLGKIITEQLRTRMIQLGYNVMDGYAGGTGQAAELNGVYEVTGDALSAGKLNISLRLTDKKTGRLLGIHDYSLPVTSEIKDYMAQGNLVMPSFIRD